MKWPNEHKILMAGRLQSEKMVSVQVVDFPQLANIFHIISRFFTLFFSRKELVFRRLRKIQGLFEAGEACTQCWGGAEDTDCPGMSRLVPPCPGSDFFGEDARQQAKPAPYSNAEPEFAEAKCGGDRSDTIKHNKHDGGG